MRVDLRQQLLDVVESLDLDQIQLVQLVLRLAGPQSPQLVQRSPRVLRPLGLIVQMEQPFQRVGIVGPQTGRRAARS